MFKNAIRQILLRLLMWTEKRTQPVVRDKMPFWSQEVHFSSIIIIAITIILIFVMLMIEVGPSIPKIIGVIIFLGISLTAFLVYLRRECPDIVKDNDAQMLIGLIVLETDQIGSCRFQGHREQSFSGANLTSK